MHSDNLMNLIRNAVIPVQNCHPRHPFEVVLIHIFSDKIQIADVVPTDQIYGIRDISAVLNVATRLWGVSICLDRHDIGLEMDVDQQRNFRFSVIQSRELFFSSERRYMHWVITLHPLRLRLQTLPHSLPQLWPWVAQDLVPPSLRLPWAKLRDIISTPTPSRWLFDIFTFILTVRLPPCFSIVPWMASIARSRRSTAAC